MQVRLTFRELVAAEATPTCPFVPERDEYERHFWAVVEDMRAIDEVIEVVAQDDHVVIVTIGELDLEGFKASLKPILQHNFCYLRIADIAPWPRAGEA
ncbi:hypothetical protein [Lysobacter sp. F60174L2]|uniref:hypothetical protein n=1 Tax=Lysobacter sp. F60174L2 TaxID=3459295 RepID=UPI00403D9CEA